MGVKFEQGPKYQKIFKGSILYVTSIGTEGRVICSSEVIALAHGTMGRRIDPSWWTHWAISCSSQCPTTGVTKTVVCIILSVG